MGYGIVVVVCGVVFALCDCEETVHHSCTFKADMGITTFTPPELEREGEDR
jgi:hypothetical protein